MPKGTKVLLVDDDKMLVELYKERLELAGYQVEVSRDGEEGLAKIHQVKPDLVLLDIMMPKVNGYEALASIKSDPSTKDIPVIILSALMRDINKTKAIESGADDYVIKSEAMPADVIKKIEAVLKKYNKSTPESKVPPAETSSEPPTPTAAVPGPPAAPLTPPPTPEPPKTPAQEIQFEPAAGGQDIAKAPAAPQAVPQGTVVNQSPVSSGSESKSSPVVIFFLVLICLLILASDLFFYMRYVIVK